MTSVIVGVDGLARCAWSGTDPVYQEYHDTEWGVPVHGDREMFERISLEAFQSGLSWITILKRRDGFRRAFAGFDPETVSLFTDVDSERLMADTGIIRNRAKIEATIRNATVTAALMRESPGALSELIWSVAPADRNGPPAQLSDVPAITAESKSLAAALKKLGFAFVGPTTAYAHMQAVGVVNDHVAGCHRAQH
ncbi:MAG: hypothetical protein RL431_659 [Actinomycetota bacterium]|jgi:DNA-3-methyladenine glycosylase I